jgi:NTP pyrophosphatase (non-canonical NTP hydrolase)
MIDTDNTYKELLKAATLVELSEQVLKVAKEAADQCVDAMENWPAFNSAHEGYAVLFEEVDELWDEVRKKQKNREVSLMKKEALDIAAMAIRFAVEVCNEEVIRR